MLVSDADARSCLLYCLGLEREHPRNQLLLLNQIASRRRELFCKTSPAISHPFTG